MVLRDERFPVAGEVGLFAEGRDCGVGHRYGADVGGFCLGDEVGVGDAGDVRSGARLLPRAGVDAVFDGEVHEAMIGRVEGDLVAAVAVAIVGVENGRIFVRVKAPLDDFRGTSAFAKLL